MRKRLDLEGHWLFCESGTNNWKGARVPGCVQLDLMNCGDTDDLFFSMNEIQSTELENKSWTYKKTFNIDNLSSECSKVLLVFDGVDTISEIYFNGIFLGKTDNMFVPFEFDITDRIKIGSNVLEVFFPPQYNEAKELESKSIEKYSGVFGSSRVFLRKAQYSFGWDWAPRIAQVGLWRPVHIDFINCAKIAYPYFKTEGIFRDSATVIVGAEIRHLLNPDVEADIEVFFDNVSIFNIRTQIQNMEGIHRVECRLDIENPRLWYPAGIGEQNLYKIKMCLVDTNNKVLDKCEFNGGIRTVAIVQESDDEGRSFIFEINGIKVFAKGANWIPADSLLPRVGPQDYHYYIKKARDANMNMLRIWGGGIYEDPVFYSICDEMGIMVWQDFMYACAQYPDDKTWFLENASKEAEIIVKSLRKHPSIVLWCGNNENNWALHSWWNNGDPEFLGNYIYKKLLPDVCTTYDPSTPYWISSPYGGEYPNEESEGDRHSWDVWISWKDYSSYLEDKGRFISEFGFQSMPCLSTIHKYAQETDLKIFSPVMTVHNKCIEGNERLVRYIAGRLGLPADFKSFVYLSQFNQAEAIKTGVEHWRLRKFKTAGTLFWQYNDCWPTASYSCIDYYKKEKALYFYSKRFYGKILPVIVNENNYIKVYAVNDTIKTLEGCLHISIYRFNGEKLNELHCKANIKPNCVTCIKEYLHNEMGIAYEPEVMPKKSDNIIIPQMFNANLLDTVIYSKLEIDGVMYSNYFVFDIFRNLNLHSPQYNVRVDGSRIIIVTDVPAFGLFIETENDVGISDNCIITEPGVEYSIERSDTPGKVRVFSIVDMVSDI